ncbi:MAG TPA: hypothetical protein K8U84_02540 [Paenalcaligenes hominis]|uniref:Uncharacterized protein n=1 Tax=Paenalcaligenes hominis TaxID=643674 RepID=A0A9D2VEL4_9BURK|nr:hypothetical protein [Paenalcaligenes hominis]
MTIRFEVYSEKEIDRNLVERYWAQDKEGDFLDKVSSLLPFGEIKTIPQLVSYLNTISNAWNEAVQCRKCNAHPTVRSRSDYLSSKLMTCRVCVQKEQELKKEKRKKEQDTLNEKLTEITEKNSKLVLRYEELNDDEVLLLLALYKAINPRLSSSTFELSNSTGIAPSDTLYFIKKLYDCGVLTHYPPHGLDEAYVLEDDGICFHISRIAFMLVPDIHFGKSEELFQMLRMREYKQLSRLLQLWRDYAVSDCMAYLYSECSLHGLGTDAEDDLKIKSILRTALETYSIAQLWSVIWKVVRDAASLSTRAYYNKSKAAATIPGKIKRYLEQQTREGAYLKHWSRPQHQPAGTLGDMFYEYFGIDELTSGHQVAKIFSESNDAAEASWFEENASHIMERASFFGLQANVLIDFAEYVRSGKSVVDALVSLIESYPELNEGM